MITLWAQKFPRTGIFAKQIVAVDWSKTYRFRGINFCDSGNYLKFCGISFHGWYLGRLQNEAIGGKFRKKIGLLPLNC